VIQVEPASVALGMKALPTETPANAVRPMMVKAIAMRRIEFILFLLKAFTVRLSGSESLTGTNIANGDLKPI
jgi:hypothetical protein